MKIVDRKMFIAMPEGVVFAKYEPCNFGDLCIKGESITWENGNDFYYQDINAAVDSHSCGEFADKLFESQEKGTSVGMNFHVQGRDGLFDKDQLFAVWEPEDVRALIARLEETL